MRPHLTVVERSLRPQNRAGPSTVHCSARHPSGHLTGRFHDGQCRSGALLDLIDRLLQTLATLSPVLLYLLTGAFMAVETTLFVGLLIPGDSLLLLAATTVTSPTRFAALMAAGAAGSLLGESIGYLLTADTYWRDPAGPEPSGDNSTRVQPLGCGRTTITGRSCDERPAHLAALAAIHLPGALREELRCVVYASKASSRRASMPALASTSHHRPGPVA